MYPISSGKARINGWNNKWEERPCCNDKREHDYSCEDYMRMIVDNHELNDV